jgi:hypothetical protein
MMRAADLLAGPRGRRLCLEFALRSDESGPSELDELRTAVFYAAYETASKQGTAIAVYSSETGGEPPTFPSVSPAEVARLLDGVDVPEPTDAALMLALRTAVDTARYWQDPDGEDVLADTPDVRRSLRRIAEAIAASSSAARWTASIDLTEQWEVAFDSSVGAARLKASAARERLENWHAEAVEEEDRAQRERPQDPAAMWGGTWWSAPVFLATSSTRAVSGIGPLGLWLVEDALGWETAAVERVRVLNPMSVYEIDGPEAWAELCRRYPLNVTASRRHDWFRTTGRAGEWIIPDWSRVTEDFGGVHLSVAGYLTGAGIAIAVDDERASLIAGWDPDKTVWLRDVGHDPTSVQHWEFSRDDDTWTQLQHPEPDIGFRS